MLLYRFVPALALVVMAFSATADDRDVYRWTDAEGNVHYSDRPLADRAKATGITSKTTDDSRIIAAKQAKIENQQIQNEQAQTAQAAATKKAEEDERYAENCRRAKASLASLQTSRRMYESSDDGNRRYLDQTEINERRSQAQANVSEWCR